ncbi:MAG: hypothetical protein Q8O00_02685 [Holophaga sp.]|nr:hypothetical protein [Holophaga sp.]
MNEPRILAMVMAGGEGTRLHPTSRNKFLAFALSLLLWTVLAWIDLALGLKVRLSEHSNTTWTHGICKDCAEKFQGHGFA